MDIREAILAQLVIVCAGVEGVSAVARNALDVPALARPAVIINGGAETLLSSPRPAARFSQVQLMELTPQILIKVRSDNSADAGNLLSLYRGRLLLAVMQDETLRSLVTTNGSIRYEGCFEPEMDPESREPRLELQVAFTYPLRLSHLAA